MLLLRLIRSRRVGPTTFHRLLAEHGSVEAALEALPEIAREAGVKGYRVFSVEAAQTELARGREFGATPISVLDPRYPELLRELPDAPPMLWAKGDLDLLHKPKVSLVGARNASSLGTRMARRLADGLAEAGFVTVSGLARGIDTVAHMAALPHGTVAVIAGGIDICYPAENQTLFADIQERGLILTESPPGITPQARHFPARNRIISGLSRAVVVVEAAARSGSLITARNALDQGREVLAVPGHPFDGRASGCNILIRDGATLVRGPEDVVLALETTTLPLDQPETPVLPTLPEGGLHQRILKQLGPSPMAEDQLIRDLNHPAPAVSAALLSLELDGKIIRQAGGLLAIA
ncbi:DNA-processing protein DprA [Actibacterium pelagium]|uniref:DNA-processing protein DprA n=1 Tax=Actibacterium pelagium TaxID=2029103 RepID=UPI000BAAA855|nr:DNA-processing protein DprA [Actibacterium pelagium]